MEECFCNPECRLLSLDSFLIAPLQRICKYPLLIQKVWKYTPESHPDWAPLKEILEELNITVEMVNERTRQVENIEKLLEVQSKFEVKGGEDLNFVCPKRALVREGALRYQKTDSYVFLFNDLLVIAKHRKKGIPP